MSPGCPCIKLQNFICVIRERERERDRERDKSSFSHPNEVRYQRWKNVSPLGLSGDVKKIKMFFFCFCISLLRHACNKDIELLLKSDFPCLGIKMLAGGGGVEEGFSAFSLQLIFKVTSCAQSFHNSSVGARRK